MTLPASKPIDARIAALDRDHVGMDASENPAIGALDFPPDLEDKAVKAINRRLRQLKRRLLLRYCILKFEYLCLEAYRVCLRGLYSLFGPFRKRPSERRHSQSPHRTK